MWHIGARPYNKIMKSARGNVILIVLIGILLFAALSFAVTRSDSGNTSMDKEKVALAAAQISSYFAQIEEEVQRLMSVNGCKVENIDWRNGYWKRIDGSPSWGILWGPQVYREGCAVFSDYGGRVPSAVDFSIYGYPNHDTIRPGWSVKAGHMMALWVNKAGAGTSLDDIAIELRGMDLAVCSYLLNPKTKPALPDEAYSQYGANLDPTPYQPLGIIDEPANLASEFYVHDGIATDPACWVGSIILAR